MASKQDRFSNTLGALPSKKAVASNSTAALQSIVEGSRPEYRHIRLENIRLNPLNDYALDDSDDDIRKLAQDIQRNGLLHNIVVSFHADGSYLLLSGERRLKAYRLLQSAEPGEARWQSIYALVRKELTDLEESIILDAANLQARGAGANSEARYRKSTARFVQNLQKNFAISEAEAILLTKTYAGASDSTILRNISIEKNLIPELKSLLDRGHIKKLVANSYAGLPTDEQQNIAASYEALLAQNADLVAFGTEAAEAIRTHRPVRRVTAGAPKKPGTARQRQREALLKSCQRIEKSLDELTMKAALMKRMDEDAGADGGEKLAPRVEHLLEKLTILRDTLL